VKAVRWPLGLVLLAWLLVVGLVGGVTYLVVDRASRGLGQAPAARAVAAVPVAESSTRPSRVPTRTAAPAPSPTPTAVPAPSPTPEAPSTPSPRGSSSSSSSSATTSRSAAPAPAPTRVPTTTASFTTRGGTVVATCAGGAAALDSITVRDGWRFEEEAEHGRLDVHFAGHDDEVELTIGCVDGAPALLGD
jgi:hypothetical protein